jgi:hypothetical protein
MIQENEELVSVALELTNKNKEAGQKIFLSEFIKFIGRDLANINILQRENSANAMLTQYKSLTERKFFTWVKTQIDIKSAILILELNGGHLAPKFYNSIVEDRSL